MCEVHGQWYRSLACAARVLIYTTPPFSMISSCPQLRRLRFCVEEASLGLLTARPMGEEGGDGDVSSPVPPLRRHYRHSCQTFEDTPLVEWVADVEGESLAVSLR